MLHILSPKPQGQEQPANGTHQDEPAHGLDRETQRKEGSQEYERPRCIPEPGYNQVDKALGHDCLTTLNRYVQQLHTDPMEARPEAPINHLGKDPDPESRSHNRRDYTSQQHQGKKQQGDTYPETSDDTAGCQQLDGR